MQYFVCSMANEGGKRPVSLLTDGVTQLGKFVVDHDRPGRAVYACVSPLRDDATARRADTVAMLTMLHVDIDMKHLTVPEEVVRSTLIETCRLLPFEIRFSGGGFHVVAHLKEPCEPGEPEFARAEELRTKLTTIFSGDPAPNHSAALLRVVGTHNSKYGDSREVVVIKAGLDVDLTEIEEFIDLQPEPLFEKVSRPGRLNGNAASHGPIDVDDAFATIVPGTGDGINNTELRVSAAMLRDGIPVDDVVKHVLGQLRATQPESATWDWDAQRHEVFSQCVRFVNKNPELHVLLPDNLLTAWEKRVAAGNSNPRVIYASHIGWHVRSNKAESMEETPPTPERRRKAPHARKKKQIIQALPFRAIAEKDLPPREFLYGKHYQRGQCTCSVGQDGAGKSTVSIAEAVVMVTGRDLLGEQPAQRYKVWLHNADDDSTEMYRRVLAYCKLHGIAAKELEGSLFVTGKDNFKIKVVAGNNGGTIPDAQTVAAICREIRENQIDVAIFDPLIHLHTVPENNNTSVAEVAEQFADIASLCDCATDIVHHVRKIQNGVSEKEFTSEDSRGGGALRAAVRALRVYNRMTTLEAETAGIATDMRGYYLRVDRGKANYLPPAVKSTWFHLASVTLDNGDDVGAIEPWIYPGQSGAAHEAAIRHVDETLPHPAGDVHSARRHRQRRRAGPR